MRGLAASVLTAALLLGLCAAAQASSIFFIRDGQVWVANPDGSGQRQLPTGGSAGDPPFRAIAASKGAGAPIIAWQRSFPNSFGTMQPDGSGYALNPYSDSMHGTLPTATVGLDAAGDRMSYALGHNAFNGSSVYGPRSIRTDGAEPRAIATDGYGASSSSVGVNFGDPAGDSLLFDSETGDYGGEAPAGCANSGHLLVRQVPQPTGSSDPDTNPVAFYCGESGVNLFRPALRPDGQLIAAEAENDPDHPGDPNLASGKPRIVVLPIGGAAGASPSPLTFLTPDGLDATEPDFSPDGGMIAFSGPDGIYTVPAAGGSVAKIADNGTYPAWSPYTLAGGGGSAITTTTGPGGSAGHCKVPKVVGKKLARARRAIRHAHCRVGRIKKKHASRRKRGRVLKQSIKPRRVVKSGTKVKLTVGR